MPVAEDVGGDAHRPPDHRLGRVSVGGGRADSFDDDAISHVVLVYHSSPVANALRRSVRRFASVSGVRALKSFTVRARLPEPLAPLHDIAFNLRWSWDDGTRDLFRWLDPDGWEVANHDPVRLLGTVRRDRLEAMVEDPGFLSFMNEIHGEQERYVEGARWFQTRNVARCGRWPTSRPSSASPRRCPSTPAASGCSPATTSRRPAASASRWSGVCLFYQQGYFRQELNADGWQQERYPRLDPHAMALHRVDDARVTVDLAGTPLVAQLWRAMVGRVPLYLLDADVEENDTGDRSVTDRLYAGDAEHRMRQEILLGIGGVRALRAAGEEPQIFHTNEGHAGFLGLERIRQLVTEEGLRFHEAVEAVRAGTVFTTHTPVPAGIDRFPREMMERYFKTFADECGVSFNDLMALGHEPGAGADSPFNMAVMGLRLASMSNGVSKLHARVSQKMFSGLWPGVPEAEAPIQAVTNGVHARTWVSAEMDELLNRYVLPEWPEADETRWAHIDDVNDDEVWRVKEQGRQRLVAFVRQRLRDSALARGVSESDVAWTQRGARPPRPDHRLRPALRRLQAGHAAAVAAGPAEGAADVGGAAGPDRLRRQGPPGRRHRQGDDPPDRVVLPRPGDPPAGSPSSRTTTWWWPAGCTRAATCG